MIIAGNCLAPFEKDLSFRLDKTLHLERPNPLSTLRVIAICFAYTLRLATRFAYAAGPSDAALMLFDILAAR